MGAQATTAKAKKIEQAPLKCVLPVDVPEFAVALRHTPISYQAERETNLGLTAFNNGSAGGLGGAEIPAFFALYDVAPRDPLWPLSGRFGPRLVAASADALIENDNLENKRGTSIPLRARDRPLCGQGAFP